MISEWNFRLKDCGPIEDAAFQFGDLTLIVGHNNTGKTYVVNAVYGFLRHLNGRLVRVMEIWSQEGLSSNALGADVDFITSELLGSGSFSQRVDFSDLERDRERLIHGAASLYSRTELDDVFGAEAGTFETAVFDVEIDRPCFPYTSYVYELRDGVELVINFDGDTLSLFLNQARGVEEKGTSIHPGEVEVWLRRLYVHFLMMDDFDFSKQPHCTSWARLSVLLFHQGLETNLRLRFRELRQKDLADPQDGSRWISGGRAANISRYPLTVEDEINFIKGIQAPFTPQPSMESPSPTSDIERIAGGYYVKEDDDFFFRSSADNARPFHIPLHLASTSATELSSLYFFIATARHDETSILIIDEPESHLDTANQIRFARALVRWVNAGIKILVSTHSDYIIKELNNFIMLSSDFEDKDKVMERLGYEDSLQPGKVRAYVAESGRLVDCPQDKYGVDMPYFDRAIDNINAVSNELTARLSAEEEDK